MNLLQYYTPEICEKIFNAIDKPHWRIWKTKDIDGLVRQNKRQINNPLKLQKFIKQCKNPQALYVSISEFLNPHNNHGFFWNQKNTTRAWYFYPRAGYVYADCILLDSYQFIDIDDEDLNVVQDDGRKIIRYMENHHIWKKEYKLKNIQFSGTKGIHLIYKYLNSAKAKDPIDRIRNEIDDKDDMTVDLLQNLDLKTIDGTHRNIMRNVFAVYAAPFSIKTSGNVVTPIDKHDFMNNNIYHILSLKPTRAKRKMVSEGNFPNDSKVARVEEQSLAPQMSGGLERANLISNPIYFRFVNNTVDGLWDNYVTVIKKHKKRFNLKRFKELQELYNLSDFHIYSLGNYIYAYNFKINQFSREAKILRRIKSENLSYFLTRKHTPLPISEIKSDDAKTISNLKYVGTLKSKYGLNHTHSKPHCNLFGLKYDNMSGKENNNIGTMRVS